MLHWWSSQPSGVRVLVFDRPGEAVAHKRRDDGLPGCGIAGSRPLVLRTVLAQWCARPCQRRGCFRNQALPLVEALRLFDYNQD